MATYKSDIEIAQETPMLPITEIAKMAGVDDKYLEQYGKYKEIIPKVESWWWLATPVWTRWLRSPNTDNTGSVWYMIISALLIMAFTFFYSSISFDAKRQAEQLTMQGAVIPGQRGKNIRGFLQTTVNRLNLFSALFLAILAAVPTILTTQLNTAVPFAASSILIAVSVSLETIRAIRAEMSIRGIDSNLDTAGFM